MFSDHNNEWKEKWFDQQLAVSLRGAMQNEDLVNTSDTM